MNPYQPTQPAEPERDFDTKLVAVAACTLLMWVAAISYTYLVVNDHKRQRTSATLFSCPSNPAEQQQVLREKLKYLERLLKTVQRGNPVHKQRT